MMYMPGDVYTYGGCCRLVSMQPIVKYAHHRHVLNTCQQPSLNCQCGRLRSFEYHLKSAGNAQWSTGINNLIYCIRRIGDHFIRVVCILMQMVWRDCWGVGGSLTVVSLQKGQCCATKAVQCIISQSVTRPSLTCVCCLGCLERGKQQWACFSACCLGCVLLRNLQLSKAACPVGAEGGWHNMWLSRMTTSTMCVH